MPYLLRRPLLAGALFFMALLAARRAAWGPPVPPAADVSALADGRRGVLRGRLVEPPQRRGPVTSCLVRATGWREGPWEDFRPAAGRVLVTVPGRPPSADWGDEALFWGSLKPLRGPEAPGGFDQRRMSAERRVFCRLVARPGGGQALRPAGPSSPLWWVVQARRRCARALGRLGPEARAVAAGVVLGERPSGLPALQEDFRRGGASHILVASGSNVAFVLSLWWFLGRWALGLRRKAVLVLAVPLAFFYGALAGADPPVVRAAVMAAVGVVGFLAGRVDRPVHLLGAAALAMLCWRPEQLFQAGFQMSFAAVTGLALGMPAAEAGLRWAAARGWRPPWKVVDLPLAAAARLFAASLLSQLALAPFLIFYFRRLSVAGLWANVFAVPWAALCLFLGAGLCVWDAVGLPGAGLWAWPTEKAALLLWRAVAWAGRRPGAEVFLAWTPAQTAVLGAAALAVLLILSTARTADPEEGTPPPPLGRRALLAIFAMVAVGTAGVAALAPRGPRDPLLLWPAAPGDAVVSVAADGSAALVDPASAGQAVRGLLPFVREERGRVRWILLTRPPRGGAAALEALAAAAPGAELLCAFEGPPAPCAPWPVGAAVEGPGVLWSRLSGGTLGAFVDGRGFLFLADGRSPAPPGFWAGATLHPRGPARSLRKRWGAVRAGRWILRGRGGEAWARDIRGAVHRPSRDGYLLFRRGRWESPDVVK